MKKVYLLIVLLACFTMINAQSWRVYDASILPAETGSAALSLATVSDNSPGEDIIQEIIDDPDVAGNKILHFAQPTAAKKLMYRTPLDAGVSKFTIVARIKGKSEAAYQRALDIQWRNATAGVRDELRIWNNTGKIELEKANLTEDISANLNEWHIYRIVVDGATSTVYLDENTTPIVTGVSADASTDNYIKIGDGSSDVIGGYLDWLAIDMTGAYAPNEGAALPSGLITGAFDASTKKIAFLTKENTGTELRDKPIISDLRNRGFKVDVTYNNTANVVAGLNDDFVFSFEALENYDLIILGRGCASGDFTEAASWAAVKKPIIAMSNYLMRSNRTALVNVAAGGRVFNDASLLSQTSAVTATIVDHPIFTGVDTDGDKNIAFHKWIYDYLACDAATFEAGHNAKLLAKYGADAISPATGTVVMALWEAGVEAYAGTGNTLAGKRLYMQIGADDNGSPKKYNYDGFTDESKIVFHNAIKYLMGANPDGKLIPLAQPGAGKTVLFFTKKSLVDATGLYADSMYVADLRSAGFEVILPDYDAYATVDTEEEIQTIKNADAIILGRGTTSGDFDDVDDDIWQKTQTPIIVLSNNLVRAKHLRWMPTTTNLDVARFGTVKGLVANPSDAAFSGVAVGADNKIDFLTNNMGGLLIPADQIAQISGQILISLTDGPEAYKISTSDGSITETVQLADHAGMPLMVRWEPGKAMFTGEFSGAKGATPLGWRTYIVGGDDHDYDDVNKKRVYGYYVHTPEMIKVLVNEILYLCEQPVPDLNDDNTLSSLTISTGTLSPAFSPSVANYSVELPEGSTSITISATANNSLSTVAGTGTIDVPTTATVAVTAENGAVRNYIILITVAMEVAEGVVPPGMGTLDEALEDAEDGDTLVLANGGSYTTTGTLVIDKKVVIISQQIPSLPALDDMPIIDNAFASSPMFNIVNDGNLILIGIDINGQGAGNIIAARDALGASCALYIDRCRLHNTTGDLIREADPTDTTNLYSAVIKNTFLYDSGTGHGAYLRGFYGETQGYLFENITYWNLGQQFNWMRHFGETLSHTYTYNHMTGYNLSTSVGDNKELFGNSDAATGEAALTIEVKNSIFHTQVSTNEGSFKFNNASGRHNISIHNNVLFQIQPIVDMGGTINKADNLEVDPQFANPASADFTVGNTALYTAADDGKIIGAVYWMPDYVDNYSSVTPIELPILSTFNYPNPFAGSTVISYTLSRNANVEISVFDINGRMVKSIVEGDVTSGAHQISISGKELNAGVYIYKLKADNAVLTGRMIKL